VVNLNSLEGKITSRQNAAMMYRIVDEYFASLSEAEQRHFLLELDRQQAIYGAVGLGTISSDVLQRSAAYTMWITVFSAQQRGRGWVSPSQAYPTLTTTDPGALAEGRDEIRVGLKLLDWGTRGLDDILQAYSEYLYTARNYESDGRIEEALLHSVFALDLLLGGEAGDSLTAVFADRVAMLTHLGLKQDYQAVARFIRETYDMRSGYVHRGERGKLSESTKDTLIDRLGRLKTISRAVLAAACFARGQSWCVGGDARQVWLGRIDILRKKYEIGQGLDPKDVEELGLNRVVLGQGKIASVSIRWPE
jgi:hypothetical protein